ncbi:MAG: pantetheine-phosphate adenylyltransferase [Acidiferrobacterales bacterium]|nr:pantetheine-phosphate adenylyltransferase [Acidiferrobacterales bacterium]
MTKIAIYPGTFDPMTNGHFDLVLRASQIFDEVIVAVADNPRKDPLFNITERLQMVEELIAGDDNVIADAFDDLLVDYMRKKQARFVIRGLRAVSDFEYEFQMASANHRIDNNVETIFLTPSEANYFTSSSLVREISRYGGDVSSFVSKSVDDRLKEKWATQA